MISVYERNQTDDKFPDSYQPWATEKFKNSN